MTPIKKITKKLFNWCNVKTNKKEQFLSKTKANFILSQKYKIDRYKYLN